VHLSSFTARVTTEIVKKTTNEADRLETGTVSINDANSDLDLIKAAAPTVNSEPLQHFNASRNLTGAASLALRLRWMALLPPFF
jgi:hypothetical protein